MPDEKCLSICKKKKGVRILLSAATTHISSGAEKKRLGGWGVAEWGGQNLVAPRPSIEKPDLEKKKSVWWRTGRRPFLGGKGDILTWPATSRLDSFKEGPPPIPFQKEVGGGGLFSGKK